MADDVRRARRRRPTSSACIISEPVPFTVPPRPGRRPFLTGMDRRYGIVHGAAAFQHLAVHRHAVAGGRAPVADLDLRQRDLLVELFAVGGARSWAPGRAARGWRRRSSRARAAPAPARAGRARRRPRPPRSRRPWFRPCPGTPRGRRPGTRVATMPSVGRAGPEPDQGEHVQVAVDAPTPAADEERPTGREHDRRRQQELDPG